MEGLRHSVSNIIVAAVLQPAAEITEKALLKLVADATEYVMIGLTIETGCDTLKLATDAIQ